MNTWPLLLLLLLLFIVFIAVYLQSRNGFETPFGPVDGPASEDAEMERVKGVRFENIYIYIILKCLIFEVSFDACDFFCAFHWPGWCNKIGHKMSQNVIEVTYVFFLLFYRIKEEKRNEPRTNVFLRGQILMS